MFTLIWYRVLPNIMMVHVGFRMGQPVYQFFRRIFLFFFIFARLYIGSRRSEEASATGGCVGWWRAGVKEGLFRDLYTAEDGDREGVRVNRYRAESTGLDDGVTGEHRCVSWLLAVIKVEEKAVAIRGYRCAVIGGDRSAVIGEN
ncbi:hypothetical protein HanPSC8_Chr02g0070671 [Helianthus annuus]|nr:hypothetical protein HanPSC8_Chr02g0070671 [Helianthus annuus]